VHGPAARILVAVIVVGGGVCTYAGEAAAQDFGAGGKEPSLTTSRIGLESSWAAFDNQGGQGDFYGITARGDLKLAPHVGLRLLVPVYAIQLDGQPVNLGLGDAELRVRFLLYEGRPWRFYWGIADQLPTGNTSIGLGQGGTQLSPYITGGWRRGPVVVFATVADSIGLHPQDKSPPTPDYVDPSTDHELRTTIGAVDELSGDFYCNVALTEITLLEPGDLGNALLIGGAAVGYVLSDASKLVLIGQAPLAGEHRFNEKIGLNAYFFF
jgi:hypothetical protein